MQTSKETASTKSVNLDQLKNDPKFLFDCFWKLVTDIGVIEKQGGKYKIDNEILGWSDVNETFDSEEEALQFIVMHYHQNKDSVRKYA